jgi:hypothetical protein
LLVIVWSLVVTALSFDGAPAASWGADAAAIEIGSGCETGCNGRLCWRRLAVDVAVASDII